jgi:hypothetical protein
MPECTNRGTLATTTILISVPIGVLRTLKVKVMLSSQGKWRFMLLVGCMGTALCWNGRLLTLGKNFLTLFFQLTVTIIHVSPTAEHPSKRPSLQSESKPIHFPIIALHCWEFVLVSSGDERRCQMQWHTSQQCCHKYSRHTRRMPRNAPKPHCCTGTCATLSRWTSRLRVTSTAYLNAGHLWTVQISHVNLDHPNWGSLEYFMMINCICTTTCGALFCVQTVL